MNVKTMKILSQSLKNEVQGLIKMFDQATNDDLVFIEQKILICEWNLRRIRNYLDMKEDNHDTSTTQPNSTEQSSAAGKDASGASRSKRSGS